MAAGKTRRRAARRTTLQQGAMVGRYQILAAPGAGGGVVYKALDPELDFTSPQSPERARRRHRRPAWARARCGRPWRWPSWRTLWDVVVRCTTFACTRTTSSSRWSSFEATCVGLAVRGAADTARDPRGLPRRRGRSAVRRTRSASSTATSSPTT